MTLRRLSCFNENGFANLHVTPETVHNLHKEGDALPTGPLIRIPVACGGNEVSGSVSFLSQKTKVLPKASGFVQLITLSEETVHSKNIELEVYCSNALDALALVAINDR